MAYFHLNERATTCTLNYFSVCKSKDLNTDNGFEAYEGASPHNCLLLKLSHSLDIWLKQVLLLKLVSD